MRGSGIWNGGRESILGTCGSSFKLLMTVIICPVVRNYVTVTMALLMPTYDNDILEAALIGYEHQKREIETKIEQLRAHLGGHLATSTDAVPVRKRAGFSAASKKRMSEAQRKRWAKKHAGEAETAPAETTAPVRATKKSGGKRSLSPEARERIAAAQRKRWAASKKATKKKQPA
jgi:hypothetical protein